MSMTTRTYTQPPVLHVAGSRDLCCDTSRKAALTLPRIPGATDNTNDA
jgi:hypothetical protein